MVDVEGMIAAVEANREGKHQSGNGNRNHDARQHQTAGNGVDVVAGFGNAIHQNGSGAALDVAHGGEEQVDGRIHDVEADDLFDDVAVEQQRGKADAEEQNGYQLLKVFHNHSQHYFMPPLRNSV